jgi:hypothetical protein
MRLQTILLGLCLTAVLPALATEQQLDEMRYYGERVVILEHPLSEKIWPKPSDHPKPQFDIHSTANYKGYEATWEIRDSKLVLVGFSADMQGEEFPIERLFPGRKLPVLADWYSGPLTIVYGHGRLVKGYRHYERAVIIRIKKGVVLESKEEKDFVARR